MLLSPTEFVIVSVGALWLFCIRLPQILMDQGLDLEAARVRTAGFRNVWNVMIIIWSIAVCTALVRALIRTLGV